jgi:hypothetical protein
MAVSGLETKKPAEIALGGFCLFGRTPVCQQATGALIRYQVL